MRHGLRGPSYGVVSACAAGAARDRRRATRMIQYGDADAVVTGGAEAALTPLAIAALRRDGRDCRRRGISRPFDARRDGFVMGEGAGVLVLEDAEAAEARGATILGEVLGYGATSDAFHLTAPRAGGQRRRAGDRARARRRRASSAERRRLRQRARHLDAAQRPLRDRRDQARARRRARARRSRSPRPSRRSATCSAPPARSRRSRRSLALRDARRCRRRSATRSPTRSSTSTTSRRGARPLETDGRARRSRSRTRSGSAATTPCSAWRGPHDASTATPRVHRAAQRAAEPARAPRAALRPRHASTLLRTRRDARRSSATRAARGRRRRRRRRPRRRPAGRLLRAGRRLPRRLARRGARRHDRAACCSSPAARACPVVGFVESGGARMQEGTAALGGYGRIFRAQRRAVGRRAADLDRRRRLAPAAAAYSPALTDFVVMTEDARDVPHRPRRRARGRWARRSTPPTLGGPRVHERNGVCHLVAADDVAAATRSRATCSAYLPSARRRARRRARSPVEPGARRPRAPSCRPSRARSTTCATSSPAIVDGGSLLEVAPRWARNIVTGFARIDGRAGRRVANQPRYLGGVLDAESARRRRARFVEHLRPFGLPLVVLVDTPGFMPGTRQEQAGVIRHGASLVRAFAGGDACRR